MMEDLDGMKDHDLLIRAVQEMGHVKAHLAELTGKVGIQNGRLSKVETRISVEETRTEGVPQRMDILEKWQVRQVLVVSAILAAFPLHALLIFEVRQYLLEKFGFVVGG